MRHRQHAGADPLNGDFIAFPSANHASCEQGRARLPASRSAGASETGLEPSAPNLAQLMGRRFAGRMAEQNYQGGR